MLSSLNLADLLTTAKKYEPVIHLNYTVLSGDPYRSTNHIYRGWDPMFENQSGGTLFNKILGFSNCQNLNFGFSLKAMEDVKLGFDYYFLRLMKAYNAREYQSLWGGPNGQPTGVTLSGVPGDPTYHMKDGQKNAGSEIDTSITYDYTEDVQFGLAMGWFLPGGAFDAENNNAASQLIGSMKVTF
jgi:hypothetical protein